MVTNYERLIQDPVSNMNASLRTLHSFVIVSCFNGIVFLNQENFATLFSFIYLSLDHDHLDRKQ